MINTVEQLKRWIDTHLWTREQVAGWANAQFFRRAIHRQTSDGAVHAALPVMLDAAGKLDASMIDLYIHPNHSGDVTSVADGVTTIAANAVTNAQAAQMAEGRIKGRALVPGGTGNVQDLTDSEVRTILNVEAGANVTDAGNVASAIDGTADLGAPADTDELAAVRAGTLGTLLWSGLKTALTALFDGLYVLLAGSVAQTVTGVKTFSDGIETDTITAIDGDGLALKDDAGNLGLFVADGGKVQVGPGSVAPAHQLVVTVPVGKATPGARQVAAFGTNDATGALRLFLQVVGSATAANRMTVFESAEDGVAYRDLVLVPIGGNLGIGTGIAAPPAGKVHVDQSSTTGAIPVLVLDQADVSEPMIEFETTVGTGNTIEAVGAKTLTTTHFLKVKLPDNSIAYIPMGTIA